MSVKVCILSQEDYDAWLKTGIAPACTGHRHMKRLDAMQAAHHGDYSPYSQPIARFVGPHHVILKASWTWRKKVSGPRMLGSTRRKSFGLATMQLVAGG
jgi:hypothetical protein